MKLQNRYWLSNELQPQLSQLHGDKLAQQCGKDSVPWFWWTIEGTSINIHQPHSYRSTKDNNNKHQQGCAWHHLWKPSSGTTDTSYTKALIESNVLLLLNLGKSCSSSSSFWPIFGRVTLAHHIILVFCCLVSLWALQFLKVVAELLPWRLKIIKKLWSE